VNSNIFEIPSGKIEPLMKQPTVAILAYNRPLSLLQCLDSLARQTNSVDFDNVYVYIDSLNPNSSKKNIAAHKEVTRLVREKSDQLGLIYTIAEGNLNINQTFFNFFSWAFSTSTSNAILFIEDDIVLHEDYIKIQQLHVEEFFKRNEIASMSFFWPLTLDFQRGLDSFYPSGGTKCFLMKYEFFLQIQSILDDFMQFESMSLQKEKIQLDFYKKLIEHNLGPIKNGPDYILTELHRTQKRLHVSYGLSYALDQGSKGLSGYQAHIKHSAFTTRPEKNALTEIPSSLVLDIFSEVDANHAKYMSNLMFNHRILHKVRHTWFFNFFHKFLANNRTQ
jgi:glycosyltransferase involved in cell wall biosynthesis